MMKIYPILKWISFIPYFFLLSILFLFLINGIPIFRLVNWLFDLGNSNPLKTKMVIGPVGFIYVYITECITYSLSFWISIIFTPNPKLAYKILSCIVIIPYIFILISYEVFNNYHSNHNGLYDVADFLAMITPVVITYFSFRSNNQYIC
jgi:hypothetical protein